MGDQESIMPYATANGIRIYYELHGQGEPLVLIQGLGNACNLWPSLLPALAQHYRVLIFDNRGAGRTDMPEALYSIEMFAADTASLMETLGIESAYVFGGSMGGWIGQHFARNFPQKVRRLVLGCTNTGGLSASSSAFMELLPTTAAMAPEDGLRAMVPFLFGRQTIAKRPDLIDLWVRLKLEFPQTPAGGANQSAACMDFDSAAWVGEIKAPTLVIGGQEEALFPDGQQEALAAAIPNAELTLLPDAAHMFFMEKAEEAARKMVQFYDLNRVK
jgi:3-oxoadipate enol-lactonase